MKNAKLRGKGKGSLVQAIMTSGLLHIDLDITA